jgi:hypothetical protein
MSRAAVVTWGTPTNVSGDSDVRANGAFVAAANIGASAAQTAPTVAINGVTFTGWDVAGAGVKVAPGGGFTMANQAGHILGSFDGFGSGAAPFANLSTNYKSLLSYGGFSQNSSNANDFTGSLTLTLTGLTVGTPYELQWWANDSRPFATGPVTATAGNVSSLDPDTNNAAGGAGQFAVGAFTADATTQVVTIGTTGNATLINAVQLRAVPEPSVGVAGAGAALLVASLRRRRRRHRIDRALGGSAVFG